jgi:hypothetical protein
MRPSEGRCLISRRVLWRTVLRQRGARIRSVVNERADVPALGLAGPGVVGRARCPDHRDKGPRISERARLGDELESQAAVERVRSRERRFEIAEDAVAIGLLKNGPKKRLADSLPLPCRLDPRESEVPVWLGWAQPLHAAKTGQQLPRRAGEERLHLE